MRGADFCGESTPLHFTRTTYTPPRINQHTNMTTTGSVEDLVLEDTGANTKGVRGITTAAGETITATQVCVYFGVVVPDLV